MKTRYEMIVDEAQIASGNKARSISEVAAWAEQEDKNVANNTTSSPKVAVVLVDFQNGFMQDIGSLPVDNSKGDVARTCRFLYNNADKISDIICTLDTHPLRHISHPCWWKDKNGNNPTSGTVITFDDVEKGLWIPVYDKEIASEEDAGKKVSYCKEYLRHLEETGEVHIVWNYHCIEATFDTCLESELARMVYFVSRYRDFEPTIVRKGMNPWAEMYGFIKPQWDPTGGKETNKEIVEKLKGYDLVIFAGEAASHCVLKSGEQYLEEINDFDIAKKVVFLKDCMSPIGGFEDATEKKFAELKEKYGVRIMDSTEIVL